MAQLRQGYEEFRKKNTEILVVGPEGKEKFSSFWEGQRLPFVGLPDPGHTILKLFGQEVNLFKLGRMPAQVLIDKEGIVQFAHYGHSMADIPSNGEVMGLLDDMDGA